MQGILQNVEDGDTVSALLVPKVTLENYEGTAELKSDGSLVWEGKHELNKDIQAQLVLTRILKPMSQLGGRPFSLLHLFLCACDCGCGSQSSGSFGMIIPLATFDKKHEGYVFCNLVTRGASPPL